MRNNYEAALEAARVHCNTYPIEALLSRRGVVETTGALSTVFLGQKVEIRKDSRAVSVDGKPANFVQGLSVYDWLCDREPQAEAAWEFCPVSSLSAVYVSGGGLGMSMPKLAKRIDEDPACFQRAMAAMGAKKITFGDIGFRLMVFPDLPMCLKFYFGDAEFPPELQLMWDRNSLQFVRYETLYYIAGCLRERLSQLLFEDQ